MAMVTPGRRAFSRHALSARIASSSAASGSCPGCRADPLAPFRVHVIAVPRSVDLDVGDTLVDEGAHLGLEDPDHVPEELRGARVDPVGDALFVGDGRELGRAGERDLDRAGAVLLHERQAVRREPSKLPQLLLPDAGDAARVSRARASDLPHAGHGVAVIEPRHRVPEVAHEVRAAELPVGEDLEPELALLGQGFEDCRVLDLLRGARAACPGSLRASRISGGRRKLPT